MMMMMMMILPILVSTCTIVQNVNGFSLLFPKRVGLQRQQRQRLEFLKLPGRRSVSKKFHPRSPCLGLPLSSTTTSSTSNNDDNTKQQKSTSSTTLTSPSNNHTTNNTTTNNTLSNNLKERLLKISNIASMLCVIDCTVLPIVTILLPLVGLGATSTAQAKWIHELGHSIALFFVLPVGGLAASMNYLTSKSTKLFTIALFGLSLIYAANGHDNSPILSLLLPHDLIHSLHCGTLLHRGVNILGCICLLSSNYYAHRLSCNHDHSGDCGGSSGDCGHDHSHTHSHTHSHGHDHSSSSCNHDDDNSGNDDCYAGHDHTHDHH